ncbi:MAG: hypothetical protein RMM58_06025 [Chloroflexota bacterium]|nr:hypothetical protein [Dehalococcoidia bacterium]MDW8253418.1 hypothetical protein [Chloroflexota bacterium]
MNDYWSRAWGDYNGHLRASGLRLIEWADRVGWSLYPEERDALERGADIEIYLDAPLDELDVVAFGAAVQRLSELVEAKRRRAERQLWERDRLPSAEKGKAGGREPRRDRWRDDPRGRRWR